MVDEIKTGAYICTGCGIGDRLDANQMKMIAEREGKANIVQEHGFLCNSEGVKLIQNDIDNEGVNKVVIAGCSRRAKTGAFKFDNVATSRVNLREGVIWVRPDTDETRETTQEMADDYIRMGCAEVKYMNLPAISEEQGRNEHLLIVGGGVSGMTAAIEADKAGYKASIVEKAGELGGWTAKLFKKTPDHSPYDAPVDTRIGKMQETIEGSSNITVYLNSVVSKTSGAPGRFSVDISTESGATTTENFGAIIQATGSEPYDATKLEKYSYGKSTAIVDQAGLEELAKTAGDEPIKTADGKDINKVVFVQCAGQRSDVDGELDYCSGHCCNTSIKQAMYFKDANPDIDTNIIYTDLRTAGSAGEDFYRAGQHKGITFSKGIVESVDKSGKVKVKDLILNEDTEIDADLVVLATGQVPNSGVNIETLVIDDEEGAEVEETQEELVADDGQISVLNLDYRQGRDIPQLTNGFTDSHFICFPYETRRTGIYSCGPVRRPMDVAQAIEDATGATLKAISAIENAAQGRAAHPRSGDLSFPTFRKEGCTQCKRCTVECPFGAIDEDEKGYPQYNESRCRRCGTCMGACPVRVISFENYSVETVGQQLKIVDIPDEFDEKPRVLMLACENDAYPALDMAGMNRIEYSAYVRAIPVRCLGSVNTIWITDALNSGYDGILMMGCKKGDNYQCHFVKGSEMAHERMSKVDDTLQSMGMEPERVQVHEVSIADIARIPELINDMDKLISEIGMSQFKF